MNKFEDFNIKVEVTSFIGDKIKIQKVLNKPITVIDFKIEKSKKKENSNYLTLQIEKAGEKHVIFTGATILMKMIEEIPKDKFPFETTIIRDKEYYEFT